MDYTLIRAKRRTIALQINDAGQLIIRAPMRMPEFFIHSFIRQKEDWVRKNQAKMKARTSRDRTLAEGSTVLYLGQEYTLRFDDALRTRVMLSERELVTPVLASSKLKILIEHWYKEQAKRILQERVKHFAPLLNVEYSQIKLSNAKTRWGSCSHTGNLNFNWRLIMAPLPILDYVVVHELAHRQEMNHSKAFWRLVEQVMPDYKNNRQWIRKNGHLLSL